jgi:soluble P-type ATPase
LHIIEEEKMDAQKAAFVRKLGAEKVVAFGNDMNDREMLKVARLGIIVSGTEGCAVEALFAADIQVTSPSDGLDLLVSQKSLRATLKF